MIPGKNLNENPKRGDHLIILAVASRSNDKNFSTERDLSNYYLKVPFSLLCFNSLSTDYATSLEADLPLEIIYINDDVDSSDCWRKPFRSSNEGLELFIAFVEEDE